MKSQNPSMFRFLLVTICYLSFHFISCAQAPVRLVDPQTFSGMLKNTKDVILLDVRTMEEYKEGHIHNAVLMHYYDTDFAQRMHKLDKSKTYLLYCEAGGRSHDAFEDMEKAGFKNLFELKGGIRAWKDADLPVDVH